MVTTLFGITVFLHPKYSSLSDVFMMALQLSRESNSVLSDATVIEVRPEQSTKAYKAMDFTLLGIVKEERELQPEKTELPMLTVFPIVKVERELQPKKAYCQIRYILFGIATDVRELQFLKASQPIAVQPSSMVTELMEPIYSLFIGDSLL